MCVPHSKFGFTKGCIIAVIFFFFVADS
nr:DUF645 family protein [Vibrio vulnificus]